ncbi:glycosyl hydrolase 115 family protein [Stenotrophomonas tumulicola]|uniref:Glycosyl hydrolase 115 family protein n=1 Tax=Stenotrophomonas tumulicola TaxID=1685415 RepID=A0A7W3FJX9_9GAMM|nr:glycosyl hydrolase 115 family protein [Stenotrophomonas tumulicola]MBA8680934.1 glycosyl hydrolase 115 family protein [Stenotrophomonas tumulicola]
MRTLLARLALSFCALAAPAAHACSAPASVCEQPGVGSFALIERSQPAALLVDATADPAVQHAADGFAADLQRVSGQSATRLQQASDVRGAVVVAGVLGESAAVDALVQSGKLDVAGLAGQWEGYRQVVVEQPWPGVERALVVVGSDRRGVVFGLYDLSGKIGVSPWYWWADVPVQRKTALYVTAGVHVDHPKVKYRGFFINDEDPAFNTWARKRFGGINADMYAHVFELLLRLKGNYLWPAMWPPKAFNDDDPRNMVLADAMGVVMGTTHHEPMMRAHEEWHRNTEQGVTGGRWDYASNGESLRTFWRGGMERMMSRGDGRPYDSIVSLGMRGDGDEAMAEDTATTLLETIVADQRRIIADVTGKPAAQTPQVWALYKEVQDYYDHGMDVPDDVILLFADDNWGQNRRLPTRDFDRAGGFGVYYHFDYVGAPRNYKWLNTTQVEKTWQQMDLAYRRGARALWIVNVGDIKPVEYPLDFFMKQAWDPEAMDLEALRRYPEAWARASFGDDQATAIAALVTRSSQYAARRKPELVDADSFPLGASSGDMLDGGEFGAMVAEWDALERTALQVKERLPANQRDAYFQLVEHPIIAMANLYRMYYAVAWNRRLAATGDPRANSFADRAEAAFARDGAISAQYHALNEGKWDGMMLQTHIGYTSWQQPEEQVMPEVVRVPAAPASASVRFKPAAFRSIPGVMAIEAPRFARRVDGAGLHWQVVPHLGRTMGAVIALPQGQPATTVEDGVRLEYDVDVGQGGDVTVQLYLVPTLDVSGGNQLRVGVSLDDGPVQVITDSLVPAPTETTLPQQRDWNKAVEDNARIVQARFPGTTAGHHVLKIWRLDDNVVLQKLVVADVPVPASYLGPAPGL